MRGHFSQKYINERVTVAAMGLKRAVGQAFRVLSNPETEFTGLCKRTLEDVIEDYIKMLLAAGVLAGMMNFIYQFLMAGYLSLFKGIKINYWNLANYSAGTSLSIFFFYLFAGTFLLFVLTVILKILVRRIRYTSLVSITIYSLTPIIVFGWLILTLSAVLLIWSAFLLVNGVAVVRRVEEEKLRESRKQATIDKKRR
jgi:hypothetical protein